jgi:hypothetical protein
MIWNKTWDGISTTELLAIWTRDFVHLKRSRVTKTGQITQRRLTYIKIRIIHKTLKFILIHIPNEKQLFHISVTKYLIEVLFSYPDSPFHAHSERTRWI